MKFISERSDRNMFFWSTWAILIVAAYLIITTLKDAGASSAVIITGTVVAAAILFIVYTGWVLITSISDRLRSAELRVWESLKEQESKTATSEAIDKK